MSEETNNLFLLSDYNYNLPEELIAQKPAEKREQSRLLVLNRNSGEISHHYFYELHEFLSSSDVLVINNTEVIPGRLIGKKDTGGKAEFLILNYGEGGVPKFSFGAPVYNCLIKTSKHPKIGATFYFNDRLKAEIISFQNGIYKVRFFCSGDFEEVLYQIGNVPLPPYIRRNPPNNAPCDDKNLYQTIYASQKGAIAAPTAGLHFSKELIEKIESKGVKIVAITLHVGYGTFLPVRSEDIRCHQMHSEWYFISEKSADIINQAKRNRRRVVAVGTTCVRTLEYASDENGILISGGGYCDLFIYPGYRFKVADAMITNFHLPKSTLLMLVSAFAGREKILHAYKEAIEKRYRFYSYGDAMFIV